MAKYRDIPMSVRIDKIGELLAKGVYLYLEQQKKEGTGGNMELTDEGQNSIIKSEKHESS